MTIRTLKCPLNDKNPILGPITNTFYSKYKLTDAEIRLFEKLSPLPKPDYRQSKEKVHDS